MLTSTHEFLTAAGGIYKAGETLQRPNLQNHRITESFWVEKTFKKTIHFSNMPYKLLGHRRADSVSVPLRGEGFGEDLGTDAGFAGSPSRNATLSHRLPPGPQRGGISQLSALRVVLVGTEGTPGVAREKLPQTLQIHTALLWERGDAQLFAGILPRQPVGLTDFFLIIITFL